MQNDVSWCIKRCPGCQKTPKSTTKIAPLAPQPISDRPNVKVHTDLFGPLKSNSNIRHMLCKTKIANVVPIPDKEDITLAMSILNHWIFQFSAPQQIYTDGGKEFVNKLRTNCGHCGTSSTQKSPGLIHSAMPALIISTNGSKNICRCLSTTTLWIW